MSFRSPEDQQDNRNAQIQTKPKPPYLWYALQYRLINLSTPLMDEVITPGEYGSRLAPPLDNLIAIIEGVIQDIILGYFAPDITTNDDNNNNNGRIDTSQPLYPPQSWIVIPPKCVSEQERGLW